MTAIYTIGAWLRSVREEPAAPLRSPANATHPMRGLIRILRHVGPPARVSSKAPAAT